jgi:hypothetical protein
MAAAASEAASGLKHCNASALNFGLAGHADQCLRFPAKEDEYG